MIRSYHTVRLLSQEFDISGAYFFRRNAQERQSDRRRAVHELGRFGRVASFPIPQDSSVVRFVWDHLRSVVTQTAYTRWVHESRRVRATLQEWACRSAFDIVHVDSIDLQAHLPSLPDAPLVLAHHNVESALLHRRADQEGGLKRTYIRHQARLVEKAEREWYRRADLNVAVSPDDAALIEARAPGAEVLVIPNGVDTYAFQPAQREPRGGIVFVGTHSWFPNADGMRFFATEILPLIREARPRTRVRWIGKAPEHAVRSFAALGVEMLGYLDDIRPVLHDAQCVIVPLRVGGGTRLKILDAWALGKAVISTTMGCEGLETCHGQNILIADTARDFAAATLRVLADADLRHVVERGGRETAVRAYDWHSLGRIMLARYQALLGRNRRRSSTTVPVEPNLPGVQ